MQPEILYIFYGALGGLCRAFIGIMKLDDNRDRVNYGYAIITIIGSGFIGAFVGVIVGSSIVASMLSGYAGIDILDNIAKRKKVVIFR